VAGRPHPPPGTAAELADGERHGYAPPRRREPLMAQSCPLAGCWPRCRHHRARGRRVVSGRECSPRWAGHLLPWPGCWAAPGPPLPWRALHPGGGVHRHHLALPSRARPGAVKRPAIAPIHKRRSGEAAAHGPDRHSGEPGGTDMAEPVDVKIGPGPGAVALPAVVCGAVRQRPAVPVDAGPAPACARRHRRLPGQ
jgi:hypothetical protein